MLSNLLVYINNYFFSNKKVFFTYKSKYIINVLKVLKHLKIIKNFFYKKKNLMCVLNNYSLYKKLKIISKSSKKIYFKCTDLKKYYDKNYILSTSHGLLTLKECLIKNIGGEVIFSYN
ncbi:30S ribosomal protein S8 [Candidatus Vidania fulgoroideorum]